MHKRREPGTGTIIIMMKMMRQYIYLRESLSGREDWKYICFWSEMGQVIVETVSYLDHGNWRTGCDKSLHWLREILTNSCRWTEVDSEIFCNTFGYDILTQLSMSVLFLFLMTNLLPVFCRRAG